MPLIKKALDERVKFIHLVRHPVYTALSLATHNIYRKKAKNWVYDYAIDPFDPGVVQKGLHDRWRSLTAYEMCLFWWTEINLYAMELKERYPEIPYLLVRYEDVFVTRRSGILEDISRFAGLPNNNEFNESLQKKVDSYRGKSASHDWAHIFKYPETMSLARQLGYDIEEVDTQDIDRRYFLKSIDHVVRFGRWARRVGRKISRIIPGVGH